MVLEIEKTSKHRTLTNGVKFSISIKAELAVKTIAKLDEVKVGGDCYCGDPPTPPPTPPLGTLDEIRFYV